MAAYEPLACAAHVTPLPDGGCAVCDAVAGVAASRRETAATVAAGATPGALPRFHASRLRAVQVPAVAVAVAAGASFMPAVNEQGFVGTARRSLLGEAPLAVVGAAVLVLALLAAFALTRRAAVGWVGAGAAAVAAAAHAGAAFHVRSTVQGMRASSDYFIAASGQSAHYGVGLYAGPAVSVAAAAVVIWAVARRGSGNG
ncbi:MAG: hypothetical protein KDC33_08650 [Thermoleophilia bacterium]|nr:hypothetical protein [Thermoleophilia bacterium]